MITCYSYIRFSSEKQSRGQSLIRQTEAAQKWLSEHSGYTLDTSTYRDLGLSGFHGTNRTKGALSAFLQAVEEKKIVKGSVLLVESLDRLSRQQIEDALDLFLQIIKAGIVVVTLEDGGMTFRKGELDLTKLVLAIAILCRGHNESSMKSVRAIQKHQANLQIARNGNSFGKECPAWLNWTGKKYEPKPKAKQTLDFIFHRSVEGLGVEQLIIELTEKQIPSWGKSGRWTHSGLHNLLQNRAVLGEWQPKTYKDGKLIPNGDPILGFFPQLVEEGLFLRVQSARKQRLKKRGPARNNFVNLFAGLMVNENDGSNVLVNVSAPSGRQPKRRLISTANREHRPNADPISLHYPNFEENILATIHDIDSKDLLPHEETHDGDTLSEKEAERSAVLSRLEELQSNLETVSGDTVKRLLTAIAKLEQQKIRLDTEILELRQRSAVQQSASLGEAQTLLEALNNVEGEKLHNMRVKLRGLLATLIKRIGIQPYRNGQKTHAKVVIEFSNSPVKVHIDTARVGEPKEKWSGRTPPVYYTVD